MRNSTTRINFLPACLWLAISFILVLIAAGTLLVGAWATGNPLVEQKLESLRFRAEAYLPQPAHPEFVPTPLATPVPATAFVAPTLDPTDIPTITATPSVAPSQPPPPTRTAAPSVPVKPVQPAVQLGGVVHDYQRWNNCGPTTLEMYLSFFGRHDTQAQIANFVKPDPEDKNVRPDELVGYVQTTGLQALVRVNGTTDRLKLFLSNGLPVVVETGFDPPQAHEGWMGHYRLVTGYDGQQFNTQDSYDGPNVKVDIGALDSDWQAFNRTYLLVYTDAQAPLVRAILGADADDTGMYSAAAARANQELAANPNDAFAAFNLGSSLLGLKRYPEAAAAFDQARRMGLPWRMMWYQFGPYEAYLQVGRYDEVIALATATLAPADDLEESHYYKGLALEKLGRYAEARAEFDLALKYNSHYLNAQRALASLNTQ